jgi:hypothetical protein
MAMKAAWVRPGGGRIPDGTKLARYGITTLYWDATDPVLLTKNQDGVLFLDEMRKYVKVGITRDPNWGSLSASQLAAAMNGDIVSLASENKQLYVIADIEAMWRRGSAYVLEWLSAWRSLRPTRVTAWTTEPNQGGTISDTLRDRINSDPNLIVMPQLYYAGMVDAVESRVALDLAARGIRTDRIYPYYDAEDMPAAWDGIVFDFAKLP